MGFHVRCNWCGKHLYDEDMAVLKVTIDRRKATRLESRWAEETRPTLHFCVAPAVDYNRMGIEDGRQDDAGSCFARAVAAINGTSTKPPDMGMEWRLMPASRRVGDPPPPLADELSGLFDAITPRASQSLRRAGLCTPEALREAYSDGSLFALTGVGVKTVAQIEAALGIGEPQLNDNQEA